MPSVRNSSYATAASVGSPPWAPVARTHPRPALPRLCAPRAPGAPPSGLRAPPTALGAEAAARPGLSPLPPPTPVVSPGGDKCQRRGPSRARRTAQNVAHGLLFVAFLGRGETFFEQGFKDKQREPKLLFCSFSGT